MLQTEQEDSVLTERFCRNSEEEEEGKKKKKEISQELSKIERNINIQDR